MALDPHIQDLLTGYQSSDGSSGIPTELYQYAQSHPELQIDRSGWNNAPTATSTNPNLNFNYSNPLPGQTEGVNWFPNDPRNNTGLQGQLTGATPTGTPAGLSSLAGGGNAIPGAAGAAFGGGSVSPSGGYTPPTSTGSTGGGTSTGGQGGGVTAAPGSPAAGTDLSPILAQYGLASQQLTGQVLPALQNIIGGMNQGFSPQVLSALRSQATSVIPKQYEDAAMALRTNLLRQGAIGAGELPGSGADILRGFGALDQARNEAVAGANRSTILANQAEVARNQGRGQDAINSVLQGQGLVNQVLTAGIQSGTQLKLQDMDAMTRIRLAQMGIDSNEKLAALQSQTQLALGGLDAQTRLTIANLDTDTQKWMGTLSADTQTKLANLSATTQTNIANLDAQTRLKIADIESAPGSLKSILLASLLGSAASGSNGSLLSKGIGSIIDIFKGGQYNPDGTFKYPTVDQTDQVSQSVGGSLGKTVGDLMKNPITWAIGGALGAALLWKKSQVHPTADQWVQTEQNPFDQQMSSLNQQFWDLAQSGKLTKDQAQMIKTGMEGFIQQYLSDLNSFKQKGDKEKTVAGQAQATFDYWYGKDGSKILGAIDGAAAGLAA